MYVQGTQQNILNNQNLQLPAGQQNVTTRSDQIYVTHQTQQNNGSTRNFEISDLRFIYKLFELKLSYIQTYLHKNLFTIDN